MNFKMCFDSIISKFKKIDKKHKIYKENEEYIRSIQPDYKIETTTYIKESTVIDKVPLTTTSLDGKVPLTTTSLDGKVPSTVIDKVPLTTTSLDSKIPSKSSLMSYESGESKINQISSVFNKITYENVKPYLYYNRCEICERKKYLNECNICKELFCERCDINIILSGNCNFCKRYYRKYLQEKRDKKIEFKKKLL
jgi:hypothetical protein